MQVLVTDNSLPLPSTLQQAHQELCRLLDHLPVAVASWQRERLNYCNEAFLQLLGRQSDQVQTLIAYLSCSDHANADRTGTYQLRQVIAGPTGEAIAVWEFGHRRGDQLDIALVPVEAWADAEARCQRLEATLHGVLTFSALPMFELSYPDLRVVRHNQAAAQLFGCTLDQQLISQLLPRRQFAELSADCHHAIARQDEVPLTPLVLNPPNGSHIFIRGSCRGIGFGDQQSIMMWIENLTQPHRAAQIQQIRQINDQFNQEMTALLLGDRFELAGPRVCMRLGSYLDCAGVAWYWRESDKWQRGARWYNSADGPPDTLPLDDSLDQIRAERLVVADQMLPALADFRAQAMALVNIPQPQAPDGLLVVWQGSSRNWTDEELVLLKQLAGGIALAQQHHQLIIAREEASRNAIDLARQRAERLAARSYELRTPLASLLGLLDVEEQLPKQQVLPLLRSSSERLLGLLQEYNDHEQADAGDVFLHERQCNLAALISDEVGAYRRRLLGSNQQVQLEMDGDQRIKALIDPMRTRHLITALLDCGLVANAKVKLTVLIEEHRCVLTMIHRCNSDSVDDTLRTAAGILTAGLHQDEHGIHVEIPVSNNSHSDSSPSVTARQGNNLIMVVEDDPTSREYLRLILQGMQHRFIGACNGQETLEILARLEHDREELPDLILMDCLMPVMDGYQTTHAIRHSTSTFANIPIVALTAQAMPGDRERCLAAGMSAYLSKPVSRREFVTILARLLPDAPEADQ